MLMSKAKVLVALPLHMHSDPSLSKTTPLDVQHRKEFGQELIRFNKTKPALLVVVCGTQLHSLLQSWHIVGGVSCMSQGDAAVGMSSTIMAYEYAY